MFWNKDEIPSYKVQKDDEDLFKVEEDEEEENLDNDEELEEVPEEVIFEEEEEEEKQRFSFKNIDFKDENTIKKLNKIANICLIIIVVLGVLISIDVFSLTRNGNGPFFAIKTKTYNDGGTKVYYGLGYKVIKYNVEEGRVGTVIGSWSLKYDKTPIKTTMLDLAIDFNNDFENSIDTYMDKYLRVRGTIKNIDQDNITLVYLDEDKKYTTELKCDTLNTKSKYKKGDTISLVGTLYNFDSNDKLLLYMKNCYLK